MRHAHFLPVFSAFLIVASAVRAADVPPRTIHTTGEATVFVRPDEVVVNLGVETWNKSLDEAKAKNDSESGKLLAAIKELGVEDKHAQTDAMQVAIDYADGGAKNGIDGYFCRRGYAVTLKDTKLFEKLIDSALKNGANHLMGFEFRTTELRKHRDEARKLAIRAAREKAVALSAELEMTLGAARTINEAQVGYWGYTSGWWGWGWGGRGQYLAQNVAQQAPGGGGEGGQTMPLGQIGIRATVNVTFDMSPAK